MEMLETAKRPPRKFEFVRYSIQAVAIKLVRFRQVNSLDLKFNFH